MTGFKKRLEALETKVAEDVILTESQIHAQGDDEACGEIDTAHPVYLDSQDTFYAGTFIGCVYQQTYVDTYSRLASSMRQKHPLLLSIYSMITQIC